MALYTEERFTEEEIDLVNKLSKVVCYALNLREEDLVGDTRKRPAPDARKILSHYLYHNVRLKKFFSCDNVALASWFLKRDHSTISYAVRNAETLYLYDDMFRNMYDRFVEVLTNPEYRVEVFPEEAKESGLTWDDVKKNNRYTYEVKINLMPLEICDTINDMFNKGYSKKQICHKIDAEMGTLNYYLDKMGMERESFKRNLDRAYRSVQAIKLKNYTTTIDY